VARAPASRCVPPWVVAGMMPTYGWGAPFPVYHVYPPPPHSEGPIERAASPPAGNPWALAQAGGRARPWMRLLSPQQFSTCHTAVLSMPFRQPPALRASPPPPAPHRPLPPTVFPNGGSPPLPTGFISVPLQHHGMMSDPASPTSRHMYGGSPPPFGASPPPYGSSPPGQLRPALPISVLASMSRRHIPCILHDPTRCCPPVSPPCRHAGQPSRNDVHATPAHDAPRAQRRVRHGARRCVRHHCSGPRLLWPHGVRRVCTIH
jgi:hypothetical protein